MNGFIDAQKQIEGWVLRTPLITSQKLNEVLGCTLYLKCENAQVTGSFKIRGCLNAMLRSDSTIPHITRSSGNFAKAMSWAGQRLGISVTVVMPDVTSPAKIKMAEQYGSKVVLTGPDYAACERLVQTMLTEQKMIYIPPSNDDHVIHGQGTVALEVCEELSQFDFFLAPIGGGGLAAGCATVIKHLRPETLMIGVEPERANDFYMSKASGELKSQHDGKTIADGLRAVSVAAKCWPLMRDHIDEACLVSEMHIVEAMRLLYETTGIITEPSGAVSLAALLKNSLKGTGVCVISGGNMDSAEFSKLVGSPNLCYTSP